MRLLLILAIAGGAALSAAAQDAPAPVKREPGSWSSTVQIVRLEGADVPPGGREQIQKMMDSVSGISVCMTPEIVAREDPVRDLERKGGGHSCVFDRKIFSGETMEFAGTCEMRGEKARMSAKGINGASMQDVTMMIERLKADGSPNGVMEMRITSRRTGACKPGDITPPTEAE